MALAVGASQATLKSLLSKLGSLLAEEYALIRGVRGDIQFIADELASMRAFLSKLSRSEDGHDEQTEDWMKQVRDVAYDIEDCIDDFANSLRPEHQGSSWFTAVRNILYEIQTWSTRRSIAAQIVDLKNRAQHVGNRGVRYGVRDPQSGKKNGLAGLTEQQAAEHQQITRQLVRVKQPVGADLPDLEKWIDDKRKTPGVLSIVGFGGVGKTTVAMALYKKLGPQFERRAMVTVSQTSDLDTVLRNILTQVELQANNGEQHAKGSPTSTFEMKIPVIRSILSRLRLPSRNEEDVLEKHKQIQADLKKYLEQYRYLLLIDDVWSSSSWLYIKKCFPENDKGSRIIVTTRIPAVAKTCSHNDNDHIHEVSVLSNSEAQKLFDKTLYECKNAGVSQLNRREVPERIWEMCGGLPLAVVTMAGLVASKPRMIREDWIKDCNILFPDSQGCRKPEEFMRIINHCYNDLDSDLKTCSLYLIIFPKGRRISKKRLTRRWIAEGFINEKQGLTVEDVAETCFNQLIERKIIRPMEHSSNGRVKSCQVHDMVLEYLISKAAEEDFITVVGSHWSMLPTHSNKVRRLAVHRSDSKRAKYVDSMNLSHVRSLTVFESLDKLHFKSLKTRIVQVLDLHGCRGFRGSHVKVSDISKMILLKYLSLRKTDIKNLPKNIHKLKYLETLDIRETEVQRLPATIVQLERIKNILGGDKRRHKTLKLPKELKGTMKTLSILSGIEIVQGSTAASDLSYFTGLRKLAIYKIQKSDDIFNDLLSSIQYLSGYSLQSLVIHDESSEFFKTLDSMPSYPTDLTALELSGRLLELPTWINKLRDLVKLTLSSTALCTNNLQLLSDLSSLFSLTFSISEKKDPALVAILQENKSALGEIFVPAGGFINLKLLRIFVPVLPSLNFAKEATPKLESIELRFQKLEGLHGIDELGRLKDVLLTVHGKASERTKLVLNDLRDGKKPSSKYSLFINEYHN